MDDEIDHDNRRKYNVWGAHVSGNNVYRNARGLGICLIGNLEEHPPSTKQYQSLVTLTRHLMNKYDISNNDVTGHGMTLGESTKCPGKHFPMQRFLSDINKTVL